MYTNCLWELKSLTTKYMEERSVDLTDTDEIVMIMSDIYEEKYGNTSQEINKLIVALSIGMTKEE